MAAVTIRLSGCSRSGSRWVPPAVEGGSPEPNNRRAGEAPKTVAVWNAKRRLREG